MTPPFARLLDTDATGSQLAAEAADEIERLRAEIERIKEAEQLELTEEWVECEICGGDGTTLGPFDDEEFPCHTCRGRGRVRAPVALGVVYDEEDDDE